MTILIRNGGVLMGRGKDFNHKRKGHEQESPKHGSNVASKDSIDVEYSIETVASKGRKPIEVIRE